MWMFNRKKQESSSNVMSRSDIEKHNETFKTNVPLLSNWKPRNTVPGMVNMVSMVIDGYSKEGYEITAVYSDSSIRPLTIPYEKFQDLYVRDYRKDLEDLANA